MTTPKIIMLSCVLVAIAITLKVRHGGAAPRSGNRYHASAKAPERLGPALNSGSRATWRSCRSCRASPDFDHALFRSHFYVAVAAAIAHTIKTTRQLAARYSKGVMAPSPSVPGLAIVPVSRYLRNGSLDVYRLDFCRHSYLSSRRMWRIGEH